MVFSASTFAGDPVSRFADGGGVFALGSETERLMVLLPSVVALLRTPARALRRR